MRNCCSRDLLDPGSHVRDFDPIWLDDYLDYLVVPNANAAPGASPVKASELLGFLKARPRLPLRTS